MKKILIIVFAVMIISLAALTKVVKNQTNTINLLKSDVAMKTHNTKLLLKEANDYRIQVYNLNEVMTDTIGKLLTELKVKPKHVIRYIERHHYSVDTVVRYIVPELVGRVYPFSDTTNCFIVGGFIESESQPALTINNREYDNKTQELYYMKRSKKFWFIKYGSWRFEKFSKQKCGGDQIKEIEVIKR